MEEFTEDFMEITIRAVSNGYVIAYKEEDFLAEFVTTGIEETLATVHTFLSEYDDRIDMSDIVDSPVKKDA